MKTKSEIKGVITALVTPFKNGEIDKKSFARLIRQQLDQGVAGFVINGTTAESPCLQWDEVRTLFQIAKTESGGAVPLIVGTGSNSTARTCEMSIEASAWHPTALLVVVPYYNRPSQRGLRQHFTQVAHAAPVPVLLYNVPSRTVTALEATTISELSREHGIVGIKEATGDMELLAKIKGGVGPGFILLSGDDASCVDFCARGGYGVISVSSHIIGREMTEYLERMQSGDVAAAGEYRTRYADLMKWLYIEANPIPVKMALHWMGVIDSPEMRLPLTELDEKFHGDFKACLKKLGKL
jgi:4-hydroxy-tetrahydrodipicolinate synthase